MILLVVHDEEDKGEEEREESDVPTVVVALHQELILSKTQMFPHTRQNKGEKVHALS